MVQLAEKAWPEAGKLFEETDVAILPVGSTEQHGPHNPLGTDHLVRMDRAVDTKQNEKLGSLKVEGFNFVYPGRFSWDTLDLSPTGVLGSAGATIRSTTASEEKGGELMEPYIVELCALVEELKKTDIKGLLPKPHK